MTADIALLSLIVFLAIMGWFKGFLSQVLTLGSAAILWFTKATWLPPASAIVANFGPAFADHFFLRDMTAGLILFVLLLILGWAFERNVIRPSKLLSAGNRWAGGALGLIKGLAYGVVLLWIAQPTALWGQKPDDPPPAWTEESIALGLVGPLNPVRVMTLREIVDQMRVQRSELAPPQEGDGVTSQGDKTTASEQDGRRKAIEGSPSLQDLVDTVRDNPDWGTMSYTELMQDPRVQEIIGDADIGKLLFGE